MRYQVEQAWLGCHCHPSYRSGIASRSKSALPQRRQTRDSRPVHLSANPTWLPPPSPEPLPAHSRNRLGISHSNKIPEIASTRNVRSKSPENHMERNTQARAHPMVAPVVWVGFPENLDGGTLALCPSTHFICSPQEGETEARGSQVPCPSGYGPDRTPAVGLLMVLQI